MDYVDASVWHNAFCHCKKRLDYRISGIFRVGKFWRKWRLEVVLNFHRVLFSLFQRLSMMKYSRVYFSRCLFLAISGRSRTQRKLSPRGKFPIYGMLKQWWSMYHDAGSHCKKRLDNVDRTLYHVGHCEKRLDYVQTSMTQVPFRPC